MRVLARLSRYLSPDAMKISGIDVSIEPDHSLAETALRISRALGIALEEETTGRFEEFPAFFGKKGGVAYALLGLPDPEHDLGDEPANDYSLSIWPQIAGATEPALDDVVEALRATGLRVS